MWNNVKKDQVSFKVDQKEKLYMDVFYYISLFLNICTNNLCYCFEGYAYAADSFSEAGQTICCCVWIGTLYSVISGVSTLHFGLGCKTTQLLSFKQKDPPVCAPAPTAFASPLPCMPVLWRGSKTPTVACSSVSVTSVQSNTKEKLEENTVKKLKRRQMKTQESAKWRKQTLSNKLDLILWWKHQTEIQLCGILLKKNRAT